MSIEEFPGELLFYNIIMGKVRDWLKSEIEGAQKGVTEFSDQRSFSLAPTLFGKSLFIDTMMVSYIKMV